MFEKSLLRWLDVYVTQVTVKLTGGDSICHIHPLANAELFLHNNFSTDIVPQGIVCRSFNPRYSSLCLTHCNDILLTHFMVSLKLLYGL